MSASILSNVRANVMTEQQQLVCSKAEKCGLQGFCIELSDQFSSPELYSSLSFEDRMNQCLDRELDNMSVKKFNNLYRNSRIDRRIYLDSVKPDPAQGVDANFLRILKECNYITAITNIILMGGTGVGKTTLAFAAAVEAMQKGFSVLYYRMNELSVKLEDLDEYNRLKKKIRNVRLLIIDDWGLEQITETAVVRLNEIVAVRYNRGPIIFTTQLTKENLKKVSNIRGPAMESLMDKLFKASDCYQQIKGESWRGKAGEIRGDGSK